MEGGIKDYELPEINEEIAGSVFDCHFGGRNSSGEADQELLRKYTDLLKEQNLLKEEHKSNIGQLNTKIDDLELQVRFKTEKITEL